MRCCGSLSCDDLSRLVSVRFTSQPPECDVGEEAAEYQQQEQEQDHRHDDDVVADAHADVEPAAVVAHQKEKVLCTHQNEHKQKLATVQSSFWPRPQNVF